MKSWVIINADSCTTKVVWLQFVTARCRVLTRFKGINSVVMLLQLLRSSLVQKIPTSRQLKWLTQWLNK